MNQANEERCVRCDQIKWLGPHVGCYETGCACSECPKGRLSTMKTYRIHMDHWQRHEPTPPKATFIEHLEVVVEAPNGMSAARAVQALLPEWKLRCVTSMGQKR